MVMKCMHFAKYSILTGVLDAKSISLLAQQIYIVRIMESIATVSCGYMPWLSISVCSGGAAMSL